MSWFSNGRQGNIKMQGDYYLTGVLHIKNSTYLLKLTSGSGAIVSTATGAVAGPTQKKVKICVDGVDMWLLAANDWVDATSSSASPSRSPSASQSPSASASASASPSHV